MTPLRIALPCALLAAASVGACEEFTTPIELNGPPVALTLVSGNQQTGRASAALGGPLVVSVTDADGVAVPAVQVLWTTTGGTVSRATDSTGNDGRSSVVWTLSSVPGDYRATATVTGLGSVTFTSIATPPGGTLKFRYLDAGSYHACGLTASEEMFCWGYNGDDQLGLGASAPVLYPTKIPGTERYRMVSGGRFHTCGLTLSGGFDCWGQSRDSRAGSGNTTFQLIESGRTHSCGISLARNLWCTGYNGECQLGRGCPDTSGAPGSVGGLDTVSFVRDSGTRLPEVKAVAAGGLHTCAIRTDGRAFCWGFNAEGQLGNGGSIIKGRPDAVATAVLFRTDPTVVPPSPDPDFPLPPGPFITAGYAHTCAIGADGVTYCWGLNADGQLGSGAATFQRTPVAVGGAQSFARISAGMRHTCGITSAGAAFCWGDNTFGQLGDGSNTSRSAPTAVSGGLSFAYIKAGDLSTCGVTTAGVAYCWGDNEFGQLGDGTTTAVRAPKKVAFQP